MMKWFPGAGALAFSQGVCRGSAAGGGGNLQLEAGGATLMRTRCLPLNERRPQGKKAPAAFEGVVRSPRRLQEKNPKKKGKRGDKVTKFLSIFNYRPICLSSPGCNKTGGKPKNKIKTNRKETRKKASWQIKLPKLEANSAARRVWSWVPRGNRPILITFSQPNSSLQLPQFSAQFSHMADFGRP